MDGATGGSLDGGELLNVTAQIAVSAENYNAVQLSKNNKLMTGNVPETAQPVTESYQLVSGTDHPASDTGQPAHDIDQSPLDTGQPAPSTDQFAFNIDQSAPDTGKPASSTDQPTTSTDQPYYNIDQPAHKTEKNVQMATDRPIPKTDQRPEIDQLAHKTAQPAQDTNEHKPDTYQPILDTDHQLDKGAIDNEVSVHNPQSSERTLCRLIIRMDENEKCLVNDGDLPLQLSNDHHAIGTDPTAPKLTDARCTQAGQNVISFNVHNDANSVTSVAIDTTTRDEKDANGAVDVISGASNDANTVTSDGNSPTNVTNIDAIDASRAAKVANINVIDNVNKETKVLTDNDDFAFDVSVIAHDISNIANDATSIAKDATSVANDTTSATDDATDVADSTTSYASNVINDNSIATIGAANNANTGDSRDRLSEEPEVTWMDDDSKLSDDANVSHGFTLNDSSTIYDVSISSLSDEIDETIDTSVTPLYEYSFTSFEDTRVLLLSEVIAEIPSYEPLSSDETNFSSLGDTAAIVSPVDRDLDGQTSDSHTISPVANVALPADACVSSTDNINAPISKDSNNTSLQGTITSPNDNNTSLIHSSDDTNVASPDGAKLSSLNDAKASLQIDTKLCSPDVANASLLDDPNAYSLYYNDQLSVDTNVTLPDSSREDSKFFTPEGTRSRAELLADSEAYSLYYFNQPAVTSSDGTVGVPDDNVTSVTDGVFDPEFDSDQASLDVSTDSQKQTSLPKPTFKDVKWKADLPNTMLIPDPLMEFVCPDFEGTNAIGPFQVSFSADKRFLFALVLDRPIRAFWAGEIVSGELFTATEDVIPCQRLVFRVSGGVKLHLRRHTTEDGASVGKLCPGNEQPLWLDETQLWSIHDKAPDMFQTLPNGIRSYKFQFYIPRYLYGSGSDTLLSILYGFSLDIYHSSYPNKAKSVTFTNIRVLANPFVLAGYDDEPEPIKGRLIYNHGKPDITLDFTVYLPTLMCPANGRFTLDLKTSNFKYFRSLRNVKPELEQNITMLYGKTRVQMTFTREVKQMTYSTFRILSDNKAVGLKYVMETKNFIPSTSVTEVLPLKVSYCLKLYYSRVSDQKQICILTIPIVLIDEQLPSIPPAPEEILVTCDLLDVSVASIDDDISYAGSTNFGQVVDMVYMGRVLVGDSKSRIKDEGKMHRLVHNIFILSILQTLKNSPIDYNASPEKTKKTLSKKQRKKRYKALTKSTHKSQSDAKKDEEELEGSIYMISFQGMTGNEIKTLKMSRRQQFTDHVAGDCEEIYAISPDKKIRDSIMRKCTELEKVVEADVYERAYESLLGVLGDDVPQTLFHIRAPHFVVPSLQSLGFMFIQRDFIQENKLKDSDVAEVLYFAVTSLIPLLTTEPYPIISVPIDHMNAFVINVDRYAPILWAMKRSVHESDKRKKKKPKTEDSESDVINALGTSRIFNLLKKKCEAYKSDDKYHGTDARNYFEVNVENYYTHHLLTASQYIMEKHLGTLSTSPKQGQKNGPLGGYETKENLKTKVAKFVASDEDNDEKINVCASPSESSDRAVKELKEETKQGTSEQTDAPSASNEESNGKKKKKKKRKNKTTTDDADKEMENVDNKPNPGSKSRENAEGESCSYEKVTGLNRVRNETIKSTSLQKLLSGDYVKNTLSEAFQLSSVALGMNNTANAQWSWAPCIPDEDGCGDWILKYSGRKWEAIMKRLKEKSSPSDTDTETSDGQTKHSPVHADGIVSPKNIDNLLNGLQSQDILSHSLSKSKNLIRRGRLIKGQKRACKCGDEINKAVDCEHPVHCRFLKRAKLDKLRVIKQKRIRKKRTVPISNTNLLTVPNDIAVCKQKLKGEKPCREIATLSAVTNACCTSLKKKAIRFHSVDSIMYISKAVDLFKKNISSTEACVLLECLEKFHTRIKRVPGYTKKQTFKPAKTSDVRKISKRNGIDKTNSEETDRYSVGEFKPEGLPELQLKSTRTKDGFSWNLTLTKTKTDWTNALKALSQLVTKSTDGNESDTNLSSHHAPDKMERSDKAVRTNKTTLELLGVKGSDSKPKAESEIKSDSKEENKKSMSIPENRGKSKHNTDDGGKPKPTSDIKGKSESKTVSECKPVSKAESDGKSGKSRTLPEANEPSDTSENGATNESKSEHEIKGESDSACEDKYKSKSKSGAKRENISSLDVKKSNSSKLYNESSHKLKESNRGEVSADTSGDVNMKSNENEVLPAGNNACEIETKPNTNQSTPTKGSHSEFTINSEDDQRSGFIGNISVLSPNRKEITETPVFKTRNDNNKDLPAVKTSENKKDPVSSDKNNKIKNENIPPPTKSTSNTSFVESSSLLKKCKNNSPVKKYSGDKCETSNIAETKANNCSKLTESESDKGRAGSISSSSNKEAEFETSSETKTTSKRNDSKANTKQKNLYKSKSETKAKKAVVVAKLNRETASLTTTNQKPKSVTKVHKESESSPNNTRSNVKTSGSKTETPTSSSSSSKKSNKKISPPSLLSGDRISKNDIKTCQILGSSPMSTQLENTRKKIERGSAKRRWTDLFADKVEECKDQQATLLVLEPIIQSAPATQNCVFSSEKKLCNPCTETYIEENVTNEVQKNSEAEARNISGNTPSKKTSVKSTTQQNERTTRQNKKVESNKKGTKSHIVASLGRKERKPTETAMCNFVNTNSKPSGNMSVIETQRLSTDKTLPGEEALCESSKSPLSTSQRLQELQNQTDASLSIQSTPNDATGAKGEIDQTIQCETTVANNCNDAQKTSEDLRQPSPPADNKNEFPDVRLSSKNIVVPDIPHRSQGATKLYNNSWSDGLASENKAVTRNNVPKQMYSLKNTKHVGLSAQTMEERQRLKVQFEGITSDGKRDSSNKSESIAPDSSDKSENNSHLLTSKTTIDAKPRTGTESKIDVESRTTGKCQPKADHELKDKVSDEIKTCKEDDARSLESNIATSQLNNINDLYNGKNYETYMFKELIGEAAKIWKELPDVPLIGREITRATVEDRLENEFVWNPQYHEVYALMEKKKRCKEEKFESFLDVELGDSKLKFKHQSCGAVDFIIDTIWSTGYNFSSAENVLKLSRLSKDTTSHGQMLNGRARQMHGTRRRLMPILDEYSPTRADPPPSSETLHNSQAYGEVNPAALVKNERRKKYLLAFLQHQKQKLLSEHREKSREVMAIRRGIERGIEVSKKYEKLIFEMRAIHKKLVSTHSKIKKLDMSRNHNTQPAQAPVDLQHSHAQFVPMNPATDNHIQVEQRLFYSASNANTLVDMAYPHEIQAQYVDNGNYTNINPLYQTKQMQASQNVSAQELEEMGLYGIAKGQSQFPVSATDVSVTRRPLYTRGDIPSTTERTNREDVVSNSQNPPQPAHVRYGVSMRHPTQETHPPMQQTNPKQEPGAYIWDQTMGTSHYEQNTNNLNAHPPNPFVSAQGMNVPSEFQTSTTLQGSGLPREFQGSSASDQVNNFTSFHQRFPTTTQGSNISSSLQNSSAMPQGTNLPPELQSTTNMAQNVNILSLLQSLSVPTANSYQSPYNTTAAIQCTNLAILLQSLSASIHGCNLPSLPRNPPAATQNRNNGAETRRSRLYGQAADAPNPQESAPLYETVKLPDGALAYTRVTKNNRSDY